MHDVLPFLGGTSFSQLITSDDTERLRNSGFFGGGQFGYNRRLPNRFIVGIETDIQWSGVRASNESSVVGTDFSPVPPDFPFSSNSRVTVSQNWFGTTRLRLGYQVFDRVMAYATEVLPIPDSRRASPARRVIRLTPSAA